MNMHGVLVWLQIGFFLVAVISAYVYWVRPLLHDRPQFKDFYVATDNFWAALRLKLQGIKGKLIAALGKAASLIVLLHDQLIPYFTGIDWTPITGELPGWFLPVATFAAFMLIDKARQWAEQRGDVPKEG